MLNGYNSKPFYSNIASKDDKLYSLIINKNYDEFWDYHKECVFMKYTYDRNNIKNLFNKMFEFNPKNRITVNKILKHEFILNNDNKMNEDINNNNNSFEIYMRNIYIKCKNFRENKMKKLKQYDSDTAISQMVCKLIYLYYLI